MEVMQLPNISNTQVNPVYNPQEPSNTGSSGVTKTTRYFNNFFIPNYNVSESTNDAIISFFAEQTGSYDTAVVIAQAFINTAQSQREDPLTVLNQFQQLGAGNLSAALALYLNMSRVPTSLLGVGNTVQTNPYVARTIIV
jgi:hypothetical protein